MRRFLPDDILMNILSKLPAEDVLRSRSVCQRWRDLTTRREFVEIHLQYAKANDAMTLIIQEKYRKLLLVDDTGGELVLADGECISIPSIPKQVQIPLEKPKFVPFGMVLSCDGLVLFKESRRLEGKKGPDFIVCNPSTREEVRIRAPDLALGLCERCDNSLYGMFLHPLLKEYCLLWGLKCCNRKCWDGLKFWMFNLGSKPGWREIKLEAEPSYKSGSCYQIYANAPVFVDGILYWMLAYNRDYKTPPHQPREETLMAFDPRREVVFVMPHPGPKYVQNNCTSIMMMEGLLSLLYCPKASDNGKTTMSIWILKDYSNKLWVKSHTIDIEISGERMWYGKYFGIGWSNEELYLRHYDLELYAFNLKLGVLRKIGRNNYRGIRALPHVRSLVSLGEYNDASMKYDEPSFEYKDTSMKSNEIPASNHLEFNPGPSTRAVGPSNGGSGMKFGWRNWFSKFSFLFEYFS